MQIHSKREVKVREYRGMAQAAANMAQDALLEQVRHKYEKAADVWSQLALNEEARIPRPDVVASTPVPRMRAMSDDQKLAAIEQGVVGSYNLAAPKTVDVFVGFAFQHLAAQALGIAHGRGYFHRKQMNGPKVHGLLVTIGGAEAEARSLACDRRNLLSRTHEGTR